MFCKTIILSNKDNLSNNAPKGILSITSQSNNALGKIRLYNLQTLPSNSKLGIYIGGEVIISNLVKRPNHYEFNLNKKLDLNKSIYCAIIDNSLGTKKVLLEGGNTFDFSFTDNPEDAINEAKDEDLDNLISASINNCTNCSSCENCEYKKYFYENYNNISTSGEAPTSNKMEEKVNFKSKQYNKTSHNLDDLASTSFPANNDNIEQKSSTSENNMSNKRKQDEMPNENIYVSGDMGNSKTIDLQDDNTFVSNKTNGENDIKNTDKFQNEEDLFNKQTTNPILNENDENNNSANLSISANELNNLSKVEQYGNQQKEYPFGETLTNNNIKSNSQSPSENQENDKEIPSETFLNDIIYQLDEMFKQYPNDDLIMSIIPNSRFVKVNMDNSSYILGVIYEDKLMKYIAYGVPASYNSLPPVDFGQNYQWLPLNPNDIMSDGYFMIYQDATNGQVVNLEIK